MKMINSIFDDYRNVYAYDSLLAAQAQASTDAYRLQVQIHDNNELLFDIFEYQFLRIVPLLYGIVATVGGSERLASSGDNAVIYLTLISSKLT